MNIIKIINTTICASYDISTIRWIIKSINTDVLLKIVNITKTTIQASSRRVVRARLLARFNGGSPLNLLFFFSDFF